MSSELASESKIISTREHGTARVLRVLARVLRVLNRRVTWRYL